MTAPKIARLRRRVSPETGHVSWWDEMYGGVVWPNEDVYIAITPADIRALLVVAVSKGVVASPSTVGGVSGIVDRIISDGGIS